MADDPYFRASKERSVSSKLREIAGDLADIAANPPHEMDSRELAKMASQLLAVAGQVYLGESQRPTAPETDELRSAAEFASGFLAELYAKYQTKIGPFASQAQVANGRLRAALKASEQHNAPTEQPGYFCGLLKAVCKDEYCPTHGQDIR